MKFNLKFLVFGFALLLLAGQANASHIYFSGPYFTHYYYPAYYYAWPYYAAYWFLLPLERGTVTATSSSTDSLAIDSVEARSDSTYYSSSNPLLGTEFVDLMVKVNAGKETAYYDDLGYLYDVDEFTKMVSVKPRVFIDGIEIIGPVSQSKNIGNGETGYFEFVNAFSLKDASSARIVVEASSEGKTESKTAYFKVIKGQASESEAGQPGWISAQAAPGSSTSSQTAVVGTGYSSSSMTSSGNAAYSNTASNAAGSISASGAVILSNDAMNLYFNENASCSQLSLSGKGVSVSEGGLAYPLFSLSNKSGVPFIVDGVIAKVKSGSFNAWNSSYSRTVNANDSGSIVLKIKGNEKGTGLLELSALGHYANGTECSSNNLKTEVSVAVLPAEIRDDSCSNVQVIAKGEIDLKESPYAELPVSVINPTKEILRLELRGVGLNVEPSIVYVNALSSKDFTAKVQARKIGTLSLVYAPQVEGCEGLAAKATVINVDYNLHSLMGNDIALVSVPEMIELANATKVALVLRNNTNSAKAVVAKVEGLPADWIVVNAGRKLEANEIRAFEVVVQAGDNAKGTFVGNILLSYDNLDHLQKSIEFKVVDDAVKGISLKASAEADKNVAGALKLKVSLSNSSDALFEGTLSIDAGNWFIEGNPAVRVLAGQSTEKTFNLKPKNDQAKNDETIKVSLADKEGNAVIDKMVRLKESPGMTTGLVSLGAAAMNVGLLVVLAFLVYFFVKRLGSLKASKAGRIDITFDNGKPKKWGFKSEKK